MIYLIFPLILSFIITFICLPTITKLSEARIERINVERKNPNKKLSNGFGGLGIFAGFILATLLFIFEKQNLYLSFIVAAIIIQFTIGLMDDLVGLSNFKKTLGQLIVSSILIFGGGLQISSLQGIFGIETLPQIISIAISYATIIGIIHLVDFVDDKNGFTSILVILSTSFFAVFFYLNGEMVFAMMALAMTGGLFATLIYNFKSIKLRIGNSGLLVMGIVNAILVMKFIEFPSVTTSNFSVGSSIIIGIAVLRIPIGDKLVSWFLNSSNKKKFSIKTHLIIREKGASRNKTPLILFGGGLLFILLSLFLDSVLPPTVVLLIQVLVSITVYNFVAQLKSKNVVELLKQGKEKFINQELSQDDAA